MTAHVIVCLGTRMLLDVLTRDKSKRTVKDSSLWVRVLLYISHWPLKVALCHNTLVHTTPAAADCHTLLLSACQPSRFSRGASIPHVQSKALPH